MELRGRQVAVVGGGAGGAAAALLLARAGARVALFERVAQPRAVGAGILLQPNGLAVLEGLGLGEALRSRGCVLQGVGITDARGRALLRPPPQPALEPGLDPALVLRRSALHEVLHEAIAREPRIEAHWGAQVCGASAEGELRVRRGAAETSWRFELVIGADGVGSAVREAGDFGARVRGTGVCYVRGLTPRGGARGEEAWTKAGIFGSLPVPGGTYFYCSAAHPALRDALARRSLQALREVWARAYAPSVELLCGVDSFESLLLNEVIRVDCRHFADGRRVLLGDAAHAMAPNLGQGANSALVDAAVLLDALRGAADLAEALARYDARRRPAVRRVQDAAAALGQLAERTSPLLRWARDRLLLPLARLAVRRQAGRMLQEPPGRLLEISRAAEALETGP